MSVRSSPLLPPRSDAIAAGLERVGLLPGRRPGTPYRIICVRRLCTGCATMRSGRRQRRRCARQPLQAARWEFEPMQTARWKFESSWPCSSTARVQPPRVNQCLYAVMNSKTIEFKDTCVCALFNASSTRHILPRKHCISFHLISLMHSLKPCAALTGFWRRPFSRWCPVEPSPLTSSHKQPQLSEEPQRCLVAVLADDDDDDE